MADAKEEAEFLRQKAKLFRDLATALPTPISPTLLEIAEQFERRATVLDPGAEPGGRGSRPRDGNL
jgi:hypothetical protein